MNILSGVLLGISIVVAGIIIISLITMACMPLLMGDDNKSIVDQKKK